MNVIFDDQRDFWWACVDIAVLRDRTLSPIDKAVYAVLCTFAAIEGRLCYPSIGRLAQDTGCSERSVQASLRRLEEKGYIVRESRYKDRRQVSSQYRLLGHRGAPGAGGRVQEVHPGGASGAPRTRTNELEPEDQNPSPSESEVSSPEPRDGSDEKVGETSPEATSETPSREDRISIDLAGVPAAMKSTVELFLLKTGRRAVSSDELLALRQLDRYHVPSRIQTEIGKAVARYEQKGRPVASLTLEYIWESLQHQRSKPELRAAQVKRMADPAEKQRLDDLEEWEKEQQAELLAKYGGTS